MSNMDTLCEARDFLQRLRDGLDPDNPEPTDIEWLLDQIELRLVRLDERLRSDQETTR